MPHRIDENSDTKNTREHVEKKSFLSALKAGCFPLAQNWPGRRTARGPFVYVPRCSDGSLFGSAARTPIL